MLKGYTASSYSTRHFQPGGDGRLGTMSATAWPSNLTPIPRRWPRCSDRAPSSTVRSVRPILPTGSTASESGEEYLDPIRSQYRETIILISAGLDGSPCAYCPFIWVDQDVAMLRGLVQGWPTEIGSIWDDAMNYDLPSKATPVAGPGGRFGATLAVKDRRLVEGQPSRCEKRLPNFPRPGLARQSTFAISPNWLPGGTICRRFTNWCN